MTKNHDERKRMAEKTPGLHRRGFAGLVASGLALLMGLTMGRRRGGGPVSLREADYYERATEPGSVQDAS